MQKPIRGYIPKKLPPKTPEDILLENVEKSGLLITELTDFKEELSSEVDSKIKEVGVAIENAQEIIERTKDEAIEVIREIKQGDKGDPGADAEPIDTEEIVQEVLSRIEVLEPTEIDEEALLERIALRIPKPIDEDKLLSRFLKKIPEKKGSLKIIQEKVEFDPMSVIDEIMKMLDDRFKIKASQVDGLQQTISAFHTQLGRGYIHGGGLSTVSHDATLTGNGTPQNPLSVVTSGFGTVKSVNSVLPDVAGNVSITTTNILEGSNLYYTNARAIASTLTGYASATGTITASDSVLSAIQKLNGNLAAATGAGAYTPNSVIFAGATGALSQDNSNFNYIAATGFHVGLAAGTSNATVGGYGAEIVGSDNTLAGVNLIVGNTNSGTKAFADIYLQNDLSNGSGLSHFAVLNYSSSTYNDATFGTILAQPNQLALYGTDGNTYIGSAAASGYVGFFTGGTATTNERGRITNTQLSLSVQETWNTGLGVITHILGPSDQTFKIKGGTPVVASASQAGQIVSIVGGDATAGSVTAGAAAGGDVNIIGGAPARLTSGSAIGGGINLISASGIGGAGSGNVTINTGIAGGTGTIGSVTIKTGDGTPGTGNTAGNITLQTGATTASAGSINLIGGSIPTTGSSSSKGGLLNFVAGTGVTKAGGLSGDGGSATFGSGTGGDSNNTGAGVTATGANAGLLSIFGGNGGLSTGAGAGGTFTGGIGGTVGVTTGNGGNATGASGTRNGGNAGNFNIVLGTAGTGATANGTAGGMTISQTLSGSDSTAMLALSQTWNTTAAASVFRIDLTDTASDSTSNFATFRVSGVSRFKVVKSGNVGINTGTYAPTAKIHASFDGTSPATSIFPTSDGLLITGNQQVGQRVLSSSNGNTALTQTNSSYWALSSVRGTVNSPLTVAVNDVIGVANFVGYDGTARQNTARIISTVDGAVSSGIIPGRLGLFTYDTTGTIQEALRVDSVQDTTMFGNLKVSTVGKGIYIKEGTNATMGTGTLVGGTATIATTKVTANSRIFVTDTGGGVLANIGALTVPTKTAGTSFVVTSTNALDTSTFNWILFEPA